jgi:hypothetical protein
MAIDGGGRDRTLAGMRERFATTRRDFVQFDDIPAAPEPRRRLASAVHLTGG